MGLRCCLERSKGPLSTSEAPLGRGELQRRISSPKIKKAFGITVEVSKHAWSEMKRGVVVTGEPATTPSLWLSCPASPMGGGTYLRLVGLYRRLSKGLRASSGNECSMIYGAMIHLMLRRLLVKNHHNPYKNTFKTRSDSNPKAKRPYRHTRDKEGANPALCESEIMTIIIDLHQSGYRTFEAYYQQHRFQVHL